MALNTTEPNLTGEALAQALAKVSPTKASATDIYKAGQTPNIADLSATGTPTVPTPNVDTTGVGTMDGTATYTTKNPPPEPPATPDTADEDYIKKLMGVSTVQEADVRAKLEADAGLKEKADTTRNLKAQIDAINAEAKAAILQQSGRQASMGAISGAQADIERKAAIRTLPLLAQYQATLGDYNAAKESVDKLFETTVADKTSKRNYDLALIEAAHNVATAKEKRQLDAKAVELTAKNRTEDQFIARQKEGLALAKDANDFSRVNKIMAAKTDAELSAALAGMVQKSTAGEIPSGEMQLYSGLSSPTATAVRSQVSAFKTEPIVTNFNVIQEGRNFANSLPTTTQNPADDQALIYSLAKALDPNSVVREGEYATAQRYSQSFINSFGKGVEQALAGTGFLSETARKNIKATIESRYQTSLNSYNNLAGQYTNSINSLTGRGDGSKFLKDYVVKTPTQPTKAETVPLARGFSGSTSSGIKYILE